MNGECVGVVGAGTMGHGIAQVLAQSGYQVALTDVSASVLDTARARIDASLGKLVQKGLIGATDRGDTLARIHPCLTLSGLAHCPIVIEAASEDAGIKQSIFTELDRVCASDAILASNTSAIPLTRIAAWTGRAPQVIGMHFMNPVPLMPLVEIVRALQTSDATWSRITELAQRMGKTAISVNDAPGFVSNRVLMPMINEAMYALYEGVAQAEAIDQVMKLGMSHPQGPLALADMIGLDTCLSVMDVLYQAFRDSKYRACPLLTQMVAAGRLGRKTGHGFYRYDSPK